jgi:hypothetical protein
MLRILVVCSASITRDSLVPLFKPNCHLGIAPELAAHFSHSSYLQWDLKVDYVDTISSSI